MCIKTPVNVCVITLQNKKSKMEIRYVSIAFLLICIHTANVRAQRFSFSDTLVINQEIALHKLKQNNLLLLAEYLNIEKAEAEVRQAKLWSNPTLDISEVNFWATNHQLSQGETLPPIFPNNEFGKNKQISAQIEKLIVLAGKRNKAIQATQINKELQKNYYELLVLSLQYELMNTMISLLFFEKLFQMNQHQIMYFQQIINSTQKYLEHEHVSKAEYFQVISAIKELKYEKIEIMSEIYLLQEQLKLLIGEDSKSYIKIAENDIIIDKATKLLRIPIVDLIDLALIQSLQVQIADIETMMSKKQYSYEKSLAIPDIVFGMGYDRGGNFLRDFIGFRVSIDLPLFNRNQGNIQKMQLDIQQKQFQSEYTKKYIQSIVTQTWKQLYWSVELFNDTDESYVQDFQSLMRKMNDYYLNRSINIIEYLSFYSSYKEAMYIHLINKKKLEQSYYNMNFLLRGNSL